MISSYPFDLGDSNRKMDRPALLAVLDFMRDLVPPHYELPESRVVDILTEHIDQTFQEKLGPAAYLVEHDLAEEGYEAAEVEDPGVDFTRPVYLLREALEPYYAPRTRSDRVCDLFLDPLTDLLTKHWDELYRELHPQS
jgi:hypothetical protein